jgi:hypothetical protein
MIKKGFFGKFGFAHVISILLLKSLDRPSYLCRIELTENLILISNGRQYQSQYLLTNKVTHRNKIKLLEINHAIE